MRIFIRGSALLATALLAACNSDDEEMPQSSGVNIPVATPVASPSASAPPQTPIQTPIQTPTSTPIPIADPNGVFKQLTDASCSDGQFPKGENVLPRLDSEHYAPLIDAVLESQSPTKQDMVDFTLAVLSHGYPYMHDVVTNKAQPACEADWWWGNKYGWENNHGLIVHECGHEADGFSNYYLAEGYDLPQPSNDYFWRQEITGDKFHNNIPDAPANSTYFDVGSTTGDQGIKTMFDEWTQYIHSVAADYQLYDAHAAAKRSYYLEYALNFAWAAPRYFLWARNNHSDAYASMMNDPDVREATLVLWGATFYFYDAFNNNTTWSPTLNETRYLNEINLVTDQGTELLDMMNEIRRTHGCDGI